MRTHDALQLVVAASLSAVACGSWYYFTIRVEDSFRSIDLVDHVFPWVIACHLVKLVLEIFHVPTFPGPRWLARIPIYIGTAIDVLVCYVSLIRINFSYLWLAIFPLIAISFICGLCMRHNSLSGHGKKSIKVTPATADNNGNKATAMTGKFNIVLAQLAPHLILSVVGMVGDPDHDGNSFDVSNFFLFLTCMLQDLTRMMTRLPAGISRGMAPASELLYKASLVLLLLTAHLMAVNAFGEKVVLLLLPEVVPLLLWFSLHLDRRTPIIDVNKTVDSEHLVLKAAVVAMCACILQVVPKDESLFYWAGTCCMASGLITYIIVLVLRLWPEKAGFATLSFEEVLKLLTFWGNLLLQVAVGLFVFGAAGRLKSTVCPWLWYTVN